DAAVRDAAVAADAAPDAAGEVARAPEVEADGDETDLGPIALPALRWGDDDALDDAHGPAAPRLPAVAADGSAVLYAEIRPDMNRGNPNLALIIRDRADRVIDRHVVLPLSDDPRPPSRGAIAAANRWLAATHRRYRWRAMEDFGAVDLEGENRMARGPVRDGIEVIWSDAWLVVSDGDRILSARPHVDWVATPYALCPNCMEVCVQPSRIARVTSDLGHHLVFVDLTYASTDACNRVPENQHVVTW
ncbi:MAG: hypothetical protein K8W52_11330, partial [Deltaproteobacteria bacterium]|nr:hypothetical protein [Deltaproteobacteria bacterium]